MNRYKLERFYKYETYEIWLSRNTDIELISVISHKDEIIVTYRKISVY